MSKKTEICQKRKQGRRKVLHRCLLWEQQKIKWLHSWLWDEQWALRHQVRGV